MDMGIWDCGFSISDRTKRRVSIHAQAKSEIENPKSEIVTCIIFSISGLVGSSLEGTSVSSCLWR